MIYKYLIQNYSNLLEIFSFINGCIYKAQFSIPHFEIKLSNAFYTLRSEIPRCWRYIVVNIEPLTFANWDERNQRVESFRSEKLNYYRGCLPGQKAIPGGIKVCCTKCIPKRLTLYRLPLKLIRVTPSKPTLYSRLKYKANSIEFYYLQISHKYMNSEIFL